MESRTKHYPLELPSFFIIGPPRTGTTWLHEVFRDHAALPFPTKETRFFDLHFHRGMKWYLRHFNVSSDRQIMGEVAPTYFASTDARERIAQVAPSAKIVCIFRNPVERVLSLYRLKRAYGMSRWNFEEAVFKDPELVESGRYATHLKAWRATFGKDRVIAMVYDDLRRDPQGYVNKISEFIGIPRFALSPDLRRTHESEDLTHPRVYFLTRAAHQIADWFKAERLDGLVAVAKRRILLKFLLRSGRKFEALSPKIAGSVYEIFRAEVEELESLLNRDFSSWKPQLVSANVLQAA